MAGSSVSALLGLGIFGGLRGKIWSRGLSVAQLGIRVVGNLKVN